MTVAGINAYNATLAKLQKSESKNTWDRRTRPESTSTNPFDMKELRADTIIREIRKFEGGGIFGNIATDSVPGPNTKDMGGQFLTDKHRIDTQSLLFKIAEKVVVGSC
jgi:adenosine deaminase CECR1